jgi:hypothetical protein
MSRRREIRVSYPQKNQIKPPPRLFRQLREELYFRMQGFASVPPVFFPHLVPPQFKSWFADRFAGDVKLAKQQLVEKLSRAFIEHGTAYDLKAGPDPVTTVKKQHLDFIAQSLNGPMSTERVYKDGINKETRCTLSISI